VTANPDGPCSPAGAGDDLRIVHEFAPAKVNLTLRVKGRRPDSYHELESLVAFADFGDELFFLPGEGQGIAVAGPVAHALRGPNLIEAAADDGWAPLADNGGFSETHALTSDSSAVDAGDPAGCKGGSDEPLELDQRGEPRSAGGRCDIGAHERQ